MAYNNALLVKQEPVEGKCSGNQQPWSFGRDFVLYDTVAPEALSMSFPNNPSIAFEPIPGSRANHEKMGYPLFGETEENEITKREDGGQTLLPQFPAQQVDGRVSWQASSHDWTVPTQGQNDGFSDPTHYNGFYHGLANGYLTTWGPDQLDPHANHEFQVTEALQRQVQDIITLSYNERPSALRQRQSQVGSHSDIIFVAFDGDRHRDDEVIMSDQRSLQDQRWEALDNGEERGDSEDEDEDEDEDGDEEDDDDFIGSDYENGRLQTLPKSRIPWAPYQVLLQLFDEDGNLVEVIINVKFNKEYGFETRNGYSHHVMYRRNYMQVDGEYQLVPIGRMTGRLFVKLDGDLVLVKAVCATVRGVMEGNISRDVELSTFNTKRENLRQDPVTITLRPHDQERMFVESTTGSNSVPMGRWQRMQWRKATDNNGSRRARKSTYNMVMDLMVRVPTRRARRQQVEPENTCRGTEFAHETELIKIGYSISDPIQARGRCPQSFELYDEDNPEHKRRKPNKPRTPSKNLLSPRLNSKTRISKGQKQHVKKTRRTQQRLLPRVPTRSPVSTPLDRSPTPLALELPAYAPLSRLEAPTAPLADFRAAPTVDDIVFDDDEMDGLQGDVQFGHPWENRNQQQAAASDWATHDEDEGFSDVSLRGPPPSGDGHPDTGFDFSF